MTDIISFSFTVKLEEKQPAVFNEMSHDLTLYGYNNL
jgi:hypothetical protein